MMDTPAEPVVLRLDGKGGAAALEWEKFRRRKGGGLSWVHMNWQAPAAWDWLTEDLGIDPIVAEPLQAEETRPRGTAVDGESLVILRGINPHPGETPEDMVSLRMLVGPKRIVTLSRHELVAAQNLRESFAAGEGPADIGAFLAALADGLIANMEPVFDDLDDGLDDVEEAALDGGYSSAVEARLGAIRRQIIALRRYIAPQREALLQIAAERLDWLSEDERATLREAAERITRYVEYLDSARDRGKIIQEELTLRLNRELTRNTYFLTAAAAIILPLGLMAGMLGMNVGGIPGADHPWAFWIIAGVFAALFAGGFVLARWLKLF